MLRLVEPLLFILLSATHDELARQVQFLRAENRILRERVSARVRLTDHERRKLVTLGAPLGAAVRELLSIVAYATFQRWVRELGKRKRARKVRKSGRPPKAEVLRSLVVRLASENLTWGYSRILGELTKLGIRDIARSTVKNILEEHGLEPAPFRAEPTWAEFLKIHAKTLWACDFFTRPVLTLAGWRTCTILFFLHVQTRRVIVCPPTLHPTHEWSREQAILFVEHAKAQSFCSPTILIRDGDGKFGPGFNDALRDCGCTIKRLPVRSPQLNAFAERWVRTVRRECLDHFVACGERHLGHLISEFVRHYHEQRPHQGLGNQLLVRDPQKPSTHPNPPQIRAGPDAAHVPRVVCHQSLGGVLKHYERKVA